MNDFLKKITFIIIWLSGYTTIAQVKFTASLSPVQINKNEYTQLKLAVENAKDVQEIMPPVLSQFSIVSGPNQESGMTIINGDIKKYIAITYILKPNAPGKFTIQPATARADGATYQSNPVVLKVNNTVSGNNSGGSISLSPFNMMDPFVEEVPAAQYRDYILKKGENALEKIRKNMFVKVTADKTSCFVGEPVIAEYKLYTRLKSESNMSKNPSFNGFSVIDLQQQDNMSYKREKLNGREYNVYTIRKAQLYPLQSGILDLEVAEIDNNVHFIKEEYASSQTNLMGEIFSDFAETGIPAEGMKDYRINLQSNPLSILVKPLPDINKPAEFKGAVGYFTISASVNNDHFSTDDAGKLTVVINGAGNLQMVNAPEIKWPQKIEGFESKTTEDLYKTTVPVSGKKTFQYPFTVTKPGTYQIPSVEFVYFDPVTARYKITASSPIDITVIKGTGKPRLSDSVNKKEVKESFLNNIFDKRWWVIILLAVIILVGLIYWVKIDIKKGKMLKTGLNTEIKPIVLIEQDDKLLLVQQNPLAAAEEELKKNTGQSFYKVLNFSLKNYLSVKFLIPIEELNKRSITEQLDKKGINNTTCLMLNDLMEEIEWQLYTPTVENVQMESIYTRAIELVSKLNSYKI